MLCAVVESTVYPISEKLENTRKKTKSLQVQPLWLRVNKNLIQGNPASKGVVKTLEKDTSSFVRLYARARPESANFSHEFHVGKHNGAQLFRQILDKDTGDVKKYTVSTSDGGHTDAALFKMADSKPLVHFTFLEKQRALKEDYRDPKAKRFAGETPDYWKRKLNLLYGGDAAMLSVT